MKTLDYDLGEMKSESGASLRYEVEETAASFSLAICRLIESYPAYQELKHELKSDKVLFYFHRVVKAEVYPAARQLAILRWRIRNGKPLTKGQKIIPAPDTGVFRLLKAVWEDGQITLKLYGPTIKDILAGIKWSMQKWLIMIKRRTAGNFRSIPTGRPMIALEYSEGLDISQKSDFVWFPQSGIDPGQVLVYFYDPVVAGRNELENIEKLGLKWICLRPGAVQAPGIPVWVPGKIKNNKQKVTHDPVDKWLFQRGQELLETVSFWEEFYRQFEIKIDFAVGEGMPRHICQSIAFERLGGSGGFLLGKQRSEMYLTPLATFGHYNKDIFFTWVARYNNYLVPHNRVEINVITGYCHDLVFDEKLKGTREMRKALQSRGAKFIVALFDNMHGKEKHFSTEMLDSFYQAFLRWLLEDQEVGLIIKSKKEQVLNSLPNIRPLLDKSVATGRCLRLDREVSRLPLDASKEADLAVGIGISSAVIEAVLAGCRGIHCDLTGLLQHEFYGWGKNKIIFNDLDEMMVALKQFKKDRNSQPELGDWSNFLDRLDPFRDGRAGERMGTYMRWLLEGFDAGLDRQEVLNQANQNYASIWGKEKLIKGEKSHDFV